MMSKEFLKAEQQLHLAHTLITAEDYGSDSEDDLDAEMTGLRGQQPSKVKQRPRKRTDDDDGAGPAVSNPADSSSQPAKKRKTTSTKGGSVSKPKPELKRKSATTAARAPAKKQKRGPEQPTLDSSAADELRSGSKSSRGSQMVRKSRTPPTPRAQSSRPLETERSQFSSAQGEPALPAPMRNTMQVLSPVEHPQRPKTTPEPRLAALSGTSDGGNDGFSCLPRGSQSSSSTSSSMSLPQDSPRPPPANYGAAGSLASHPVNQAAAVGAQSSLPNSLPASSTARARTALVQDTCSSSINPAPKASRTAAPLPYPLEAEPRPGLPPASHIAAQSTAQTELSQKPRPRPRAMATTSSSISGQHDNDVFDLSRKPHSPQIGSLRSGSTTAPQPLALPPSVGSDVPSSSVTDSGKPVATTKPPKGLSSSSAAQIKPSFPMLPPSSRNPATAVGRLAAAPQAKNGSRAGAPPPASAPADTAPGSRSRDLRMDTDFTPPHQQSSQTYSEAERALALQLGYASETDSFATTARTSERQTKLVGTQPSQPGDELAAGASRSRRISPSPTDRTARRDQPAAVRASVSTHHPAQLTSTSQTVPPKPRVTARGTFARQANANRLLVPDSAGDMQASSATPSCASTSGIPGAAAAQAGAFATGDPIESSSLPALSSNRPSSAASSSQPPSTGPTQMPPRMKKSGFAKPSFLHGSGSKADTAARSRAAALDERDKQAQFSAARPRSPTHVNPVKIATALGRSSQPSKK